MFYVKSHVPERKRFTINSKPVESVTLGYSTSSSIVPNFFEKLKTAKSKHNNKQLELFFGLENSFESIIRHFATKMLTTNGMRNNDFLRRKVKQKVFEDTKTELSANPPIQLSSLQKEKTAPTDVTEKTVNGFFLQE